MGVFVLEAVKVCVVEIECVSSSVGVGVVLDVELAVGVLVLESATLCVVDAEKDKLESAVGDALGVADVDVEPVAVKVALRVGTNG